MNSNQQYNKLNPPINIPLSVPEIKGNEWDYVKECLDTNWVSYVGHYVNKFEEVMADYVGVQYAIATASGTAALHTALLVAGIQENDEVLVSTLTFVAPVNAIRYVGAWPVFIDSEPKYWQMDPNKVVDFLNQECRWKNGKLYNRLTGRQIKAILPVHILGHPVDINSIVEIARKFNLTVIEDAAESLGAKYYEKSVGDLGDISCFSFNGNKVVTTGGGGALLTNNEEWAVRAKHLTTQSKQDSLEYVHDEIGYNYRMNNIAAAIGVAQMEQIDSFIDKKRQIASMYFEGLQDLADCSLMEEAKYAFSTFWLYTLLIHESAVDIDSRQVIRELQEFGIQSRPLWRPAHRQKMFQDCVYYGADCADSMNALGVQLPSSVGLQIEEQEYVIQTLCSLLNR
ncbi:MAG: aminotransferase DegT [Anaerolineaceae bacterium]|nr:aminotransferase DegT [Anaerolineaceae bacterium]